LKGDDSTCFWESNPNGGTGVSEEWARRMAIEELKNLCRLLLAELVLNRRTRWDARMSEEQQEKDDLLDLGDTRPSD
jgi:hypothetical protein